MENSVYSIAFLIAGRENTSDENKQLDQDGELFMEGGG